MKSHQSDLSPAEIRDIIHSETPRMGPNSYITHIYMILVYSWPLETPRTGPGYHIPIIYIVITTFNQYHSTRS